MEHWRNVAAIVALIVVPSLASSQLGAHEAPRKIEPRRIEPRSEEQRSYDRDRDRILPDGTNPFRPPAGNPWRPPFYRTPEQQRVSTLQRMEESAAKRDWIQVWEESKTLPAGRYLDSNREVSLRLEAARNLLGKAARARARADWKDVRTSLETMTDVSSVTAVDNIEWTSIYRFYHYNPRTGKSEQPLGELDPRIKLRNALGSARKLYGEATGELAQQSLRAGDPGGAVSLFRELFASVSDQATPKNVSLFKKAFLASANADYEKHDWQSTSAACEEIQKQQYFSLTPTEKERIFLLNSRSQNWSEVTSLPRTTLVVDHITTESRASFFHIFGAAGAVDLLLKVDTMRELLDDPDFRPAKDQILKGSDLLLAPSVTKDSGSQESLRQSFPDATIWTDPYITEASESLSALQQLQLTPKDFDLAILLPKNAEQQAVMGLNWTEAQRSRAWLSAEYLKSNARDSPVVTQSVNRTGLWGWVTDLMGTDSKKDVMHSLENSKGVFILFAHGDREGVYTPEGQKLTVEDVRKLDLHKNRPVVLLLSCEGGRGASDASSSLAQELKKSGATAIWSYGQKVDAAEASSVAVKFVENIRAGKTLLESFRLLRRDGAVKAGPEVHLKVELRRQYIHRVAS